MRRCEFCDSPVPADAVVCPVCKEEIAEETLERLLPLLKRPEEPEVKRMGITQRMWGTIRRPAATYRDIGQRPDSAGPFVIVLLNALIMGVIMLLMTSRFTTTVSMFDPVVNATVPTQVSVLTGPQALSFWMVGLATIVPNILIGMIFLGMGSVFAHIAIKIMGGSGTKGQTLSIVGYSMMPVLLIRLISIILIYSAMPTAPIGTAQANAETLVLQIFSSSIWLTIDYLTTGAFLWTGFLLIFGVREAHNTSTQWATIISIACIIVLVWTFWQMH
ncbi:MAG: conserved membrane protein of unknown function [Candidatus Thorarchaeota archaeon]|nr:MAG: conserved membrane protein of unknown function [Candidatus Thorarchaeota archaeon]